MFVGQIRSTALDILQAAGVDYTAATTEMDAVVLRIMEDQRSASA